MRLMVSRIDVDKKQIKIIGSKAALASVVQADKSLNREVPGFVRKIGALGKIRTPDP